MVELAWLWLQNQPTSALSLWFHERCALKAHETMSPEMAAAVKPSRQPRTESCVELGNGLCEA